MLSRQRWQKAIHTALALALVAMLVVAFLPQPAHADPDPDWLGTWENRVRITIDHDDIDAALSDFPILVYISASSGINSEDISFVFDELTADANRKKIAVTTDDGTTECYVEIEKWDDTAEEAWLWVKVPAVAHDADTDLYLYYDVDHADNDAKVGDTNDEVAENVWDSNFKAVYHMRDGVDDEAWSESVLIGSGQTFKYIHHIYKDKLKSGEVSFAIYKEGESTPFEQATYYIHFD